MDITAIIEMLQRLHGKLEIKFSESDNAKISSVCLIFIKIPIHTDRVAAVQKMVTTLKKPPLSQGRLDVQVIPRKGGMFIGIMRIKDVESLVDSALSLVSRMETITQQASGQDVTRWRQENGTGSVFGIRSS